MEDNQKEATTKAKIKADPETDLDNTPTPHQSRCPVFGRQGQPGNESAPKALPRKKEPRYTARPFFQVNQPIRRSSRKRKTPDDDTDIEIVPVISVEAEIIDIADSDPEDEEPTNNTQAAPNPFHVAAGPSPNLGTNRPEGDDRSTTEESSEANDTGEIADPTFSSTACPDEKDALKWRSKGEMKYYFGPPSPGSRNLAARNPVAQTQQTSSRRTLRHAAQLQTLNQTGDRL